MEPAPEDLSPDDITGPTLANNTATTTLFDIVTTADAISGEQQAIMADADAGWGPFPMSRMGHWLLSFAYMTTATTIVSGAVAERISLCAYYTLTSGICAFSYPVGVHWIWSSEGWSSPWSSGRVIANGALDFAGSGVIHFTGEGGSRCPPQPELAWHCPKEMVRICLPKRCGNACLEMRRPGFQTHSHTILGGGGSCYPIPHTGGLGGLVAAAILGPRYLPGGKCVFSEEGQAIVAPHNKFSSAIGCLLLWTGWYAFNAGQG
eukprot:gene57531-biopygen70199